MQTKSNKVNIITLGCAKNIYDSEILLSQLNANSIQVEHESESDDAKVVIINTCGFIKNAKQESITTILAQVERKEKGEINQLFVTGCLSERYKTDLQKEISNVDQYFGTSDMIELLKALGAKYKHELLGDRKITTPKHYAYLKVSEGCDRVCSFCAIPLMRGKHKSKPIEDLVNETENLARNGVKEIILIAQDLTFYGLDIYKKRALSSLLSKISEVDGIEWIRLHYCFPTGFPEDVLEVIRTNKKVCNYIDIPLQHINTQILKSMRRGTTYERTTDLLQMFRRKVPDIAIRTTLIVGYPGENEEIFNELKDWVKLMKFDRLGVFTYSHEEDTHAYKLQETVSEELKKDRLQQLMDVQMSISLKKNQNKVGQTLTVLFDRLEGDFFIGRTEFDSPEVDNEVIVPAANKYVRFGEFRKVRITKADHYDLYGEIID